MYWTVEQEFDPIERELIFWIVSPEAKRLRSFPFKEPAEQLAAALNNSAKALLSVRANHSLSFLESGSWNAPSNAMATLGPEATAIAQRWRMLSPKQRAVIRQMIDMCVDELPVERTNVA